MACTRYQNVNSWILHIDKVLWGISMVLWWAKSLTRLIFGCYKFRALFLLLFFFLKQKTRRTTSFKYTSVQQRKKHTTFGNIIFFGFVKRTPRFTRSSSINLLDLFLITWTRRSGMFTDDYPIYLPAEKIAITRNSPCHRWLTDHLLPNVDAVVTNSDSSIFQDRKAPYKKFLSRGFFIGLILSTTWRWASYSNVYRFGKRGNYEELRVSRNPAKTSYGTHETAKLNSAWPKIFEIKYV